MNESPNIPRVWSVAVGRSVQQVAAESRSIGCGCGGGWKLRMENMLKAPVQLYKQASPLWYQVRDAPFPKTAVSVATAGGKWAHKQSTDRQLPKPQQATGRQTDI